VQLLPGNSKVDAALADVTADGTTAVASDIPSAAIALLTALGKVVPQPRHSSQPHEPASIFLSSRGSSH